MRLLHVATKQFKHLVGSEESSVPYAILSHTWGGAGEEVTFQDVDAFRQGLEPVASTEGARKIEGCCVVAQNLQFEWIWVDTCSIDKTSSAELSEAINSMYKWYKDASVCFVYLSDVSAGPDQEDQMRQSRWFKRGWTLQELLAPKRLHFYDRNWQLLGDRDDLEQLIAAITRIPREAFAGRLSRYSIAQRMCWAAGRETTRSEDRAYSLLGIFRVNMPLLYGEGNNAFRRLQEEIIKRSDDHTILAWGYRRDAPAATPDEKTFEPALARSPDDFDDCHDIIPCQAYSSKQRIFEVDNKGIHISLPMTRLRDARHCHALLNCCRSDSFTDIMALDLSARYPIRGTYQIMLFPWFTEGILLTRGRNRRPCFMPARKSLLTTTMGTVHISLGEEYRDRMADVRVLVQPSCEVEFANLILPRIVTAESQDSKLVLRTNPMREIDSNTISYFSCKRQIAIGREETTSQEVFVRVLLSKNWGETSLATVDEVTTEPWTADKLERLVWRGSIESFAGNVRRRARWSSIHGLPVFMIDLDFGEIKEYRRSRFLNFLRTSESLNSRNLDGAFSYNNIIKGGMMLVAAGLALAFYSLHIPLGFGLGSMSLSILVSMAVIDSKEGNWSSLNFAGFVMFLFAMGLLGSYESDPTKIS